MHYILFEDQSHFDLRPFTFTRPIFQLRAGILTSYDRWKYVLDKIPQTVAYDYLADRYGSPSLTGDCIWINGKFCPNEELLRLIQSIEPETYYTNEQGEVYVARFNPSLLPVSFDGVFRKETWEILELKMQEINIETKAIRYPYDIFQLNRHFIHYDFALVTANRKSEGVKDPYTRVYGKDNLFVEEGVDMKAAIINAEDGLVYIGKNVKIQEGAIVHGSHALCHNVTVSMGAKLRGDSAFGPYVKIGGEVGNSVLMGYSNKGHDGYLGNSVLGYWCNLGADTNTSNLKNNYASVRLWHYPTGRFRDTGTQFCGLMMGDHSKCGINTMFNTGTVVGVSANVFGGGYPRNFIPSFSWGGSAGYTTYRMRKVCEVAEKVMIRRKVVFDEQERNILQTVFDRTAQYRPWDRKKK